MTERRMFRLPLFSKRRSTLGEVPSGEIPVVTDHEGPEPTTPTEYERLTTELNGGVPLGILAQEGKGSMLRVPFRDFQRWKIVTGVGIALTPVAALAIYKITMKILEACNKPHR